jgi:hypothetical protein
VQVAKQHPQDSASRLAGDLYAKILNREADQEGYDYVLRSLHEGRKSVRDHALDMIDSEEFAQRFLHRNDPQQTARLLNRLLLGRTLDDRSLALEAARCMIMGRRAYAELLTETVDYRRSFGDDQSPKYGH